VDEQTPPPGETPRFEPEFILPDPQDRATWRMSRARPESEKSRFVGVGPFGHALAVVIGLLWILVLVLLIGQLIIWLRPPAVIAAFAVVSARLSEPLRRRF